MSSLDPFGGPPSRPIGGYGGYKPRSKNGDGLWENLEGTAREFGSTVGSQLTSKGARGWNGFNGILSMADMLFGLVFLFCSVKMGDVVLFATAIAVGALSAYWAPLAFCCGILTCNRIVHDSVIAAVLA